MNGEMVRRATGNQPGSMLYRVAADPKLDNGQNIRYLYEAALSRVPTRQELAISNELLLARNGNVGAALQDIWWACSTERVCLIRERLSAVSATGLAEGFCLSVWPIAIADSR
jgi:hypothetical protein